MSDKRYLGNIITQNPTAPAGNFGDSAAKGVWSLEEQLAYQKAGLWPVPGNFPLNVEDVFSTYLYTGNGGTQTITNGIDLDGEGGLVWVKKRQASASHGLYDTERGVNKLLISESTNAQATYSGVNAFYSSGFGLGSGNEFNQSSQTFVSWTWRKAPKFFDVVTWTGDGTTNRQISHNLGSTPAAIIVKCTSVSTNWVVYHKDLTNANYCLILNSTLAQISDSTVFGTAPTDTVFTVARTGVSSNTNQNGATYVAYLFAHNDGDGDFGPDGDADIIKCGSWTANQPSTVTLGFEPQWLLVKRIDGASQWHLVDNMRGADFSTYQALFANLSNAEAAQAGETFTFNPDGFTYYGSVVGGGNECIYIAIRRGTKVPESGTEVFGISYAQNVNAVPFPVDFMLNKIYGGGNTYARDRLRGGTKYLLTETTNADLTGSDIGFDDMTGNTAVWGTGFINYNWKRAPGFVDVVAYTGDGVAGRTVSHNLGVAPEMIILKGRNYTTDWAAYHASLGNTKYLIPNTTAAAGTSSLWWNNTSPTASEFTLGNSSRVNNTSSNTYIAYLFATLAGISKVGSASHSGTTNVDCGFTSGARFVLLKRTDATGDWYVWDSERGIVSGNDPYFLLNTTAAQVTSTDYIDPLSSGFTITSSFTAGDYIFYAIA
jgi:hypothetical protein